MKRAAGALCAAALLATGACARQDTAVVLMVVTVSGTVPNATGLTVKVTNLTTGANSTRAYGGDRIIVFPTTLSAEIPGSAAGTLKFHVDAQVSGGTAPSGDSDPQTVQPGTSSTISLQLTCGGNPCVAPTTGGGPDGGTVTQPNCGNGLVDPGETCDTAIPAGAPGACPINCDDGIACTTDTLLAKGCETVCKHTVPPPPANPPPGRDGCCPAFANAATDPDCSPTCGNGTVDPGETCDTAIPAGSPGACSGPADCTPSGPCVIAQLVSQGTCSAVCLRTAILTPANGDGCCPPGASNAIDTDCPATCGDGIRGAGETCDVGIPPPQTGSCPISCDDGDPCTTDLLSGAGCHALCVHLPVTLAISGDGCCLAGSTRATDSDCPSLCGDGVVEPGETCDPTATGPGACPTACPPSPAACLQTALTGAAASCTATCVSSAITACGASDGCCPAGCAFAQDADCSPTCGDGVVQAGESCDVAIAAGQPGACPETCQDADACTDDRLLSGGTCQASCVHLVVTAAVAGDGCCPASADFLVDADCAPACGNGVVERPVESCDVGVSGSCPMSCPRPDLCTTVALRGDPSTCSAACVTTPVVACAGGDGCCPAGCTAATDSDCSIICGDGVVETGEVCDRAITAGLPGACPASCDDGDACTVDLTAGSISDCTRSCTHAAVTACLNGDGCCPAGCTTATDSDCSASCNDGHIEAGETCDPPSTCPTTCPDDGDPCTLDQLVGDPQQCNAACRHVPITTCSATRSDHCCPSVCNAGNDTDC